MWYNNKNVHVNKREIIKPKYPQFIYHQIDIKSIHYLKVSRKRVELSLKGAARTQAPTSTNYDVGSPTWGDLRWAPLLSAMEVTNLGHGPS